MTQQVRIIIPFSLLLVLIIVSPLKITAATNVQASYVPEPYLYLQQSPGAFTSPTMVGAKLGRLTVEFTGGPIFNPGVQTSGQGGYGNIIISGMLSNYPGGTKYYNTYIPMNVVTVAYPYGLSGTPYVHTMYGSRQALLIDEKETQVSISPFIVDFYLLNTNAGNGQYSTTFESNLGTGQKDFDFTTQYTFNNPFNPTYALGLTKTFGGGLWQIPTSGDPVNQDAFFVEIDGVAGSGTTPFVGSGGLNDHAGNSNDQTGFWNGTEIPTQYDPYFEILFQDKTVTFDLSKAYGNNKESINTVEIIVNDGDPAETYEVEIAFSDSSNENKFQLKHPDANSNIDFQLFIEGRTEEIPYNTPIPWENLVPFPNENKRTLSIGGINATHVQQRLSGSYTDTIYVNIISTF